MSLIFGFISTVLSSLVKPVFDFLNKRVDADMQKHIVDTNAIRDVAGAGLSAISKADELNAATRQKEGNWGPTVIFMAVILAPFVWHEWQVVLDSSRFIPTIGWAWGFVPYPTTYEHAVGSWRIPALPDPWGAVELSIFSSFFVGATAAVAAVAAIKAIRK